MIKRACELKPGDEIRWINKTVMVESVYTDLYGDTKINTNLWPIPWTNKDTQFLVVGNLADEVGQFLEARIETIQGQ